MSVKSRLVWNESNLSRFRRTKNGNSPSNSPSSTSYVVVRDFTQFHRAERHTASSLHFFVLFEAVHLGAVLHLVFRGITVGVNETRTCCDDS
mmetsp:Transcript_34723/g.102067  ORF Transcript_34723/g.102067 Transcript_34723/m.102067 type:complete len:92 (+) Transcript_34723:162-437(+)